VNGNKSVGKFDQFVENIKIKHGTLIFVIGAILFPISILANFFQLWDSASFAAIIKILYEAVTAITVGFPTIAVSIVAIFAGLFWFKERALRKALESSSWNTSKEALSESLQEISEEIKRTIRISHSGAQNSELVKNLETVGSFYSKFQYLLVTSKNSLICVCGVNREWTYKLVFSVFVSRTRGNRIFILCTAEEKEQKRFRLLASLGCVLKVVDEACFSDKFRGVIVNPSDHSDCHAILIHKDAQPIYGNYYFGPFDAHAINLFFRSVEELIGMNESKDEAAEDFIPCLEGETEKSVLERMLNVSFYRNGVFEFREVLVSDTIPVSSFIEQFKYNQVRELFETFKRQGVSLFNPQTIKLRNGLSSTILPPVLEEKKGLLYVAEGHTRLYYQRFTNPEIPVRVLVVKNIEEKFSREPSTWDQVEIKIDKEPYGENAGPYARNIEGQFRDEILDRL